MTTEIADKGIHAGKPMWPSLQTADWLFSASNIALIVGLALTVVATIGAVWMANVRDGYLKRELAEANARIADASARGAEAKSVAAKANADAASANERAANLEVVASRLRLELDEEIQKRALRQITDEQKTAIIDAIRGEISAINVVVQKNTEARYFARTLESVFRVAGVQSFEYDLPAGEIMADSRILMYKPGGETNQDNLAGDPLFVALNNAGIFGGTTSKPFSSLEQLYKASMLPRDIYTIYIGEKTTF